MKHQLLPPEKPVALPAQPRGWLGPLFYWEVIRECRRGNSYLPRVLYASGLLFLVYLAMGNTEITQKRIAYLCDVAFSYYLVLQYVAIVLLTPAYVAGAIIEERQQRTLPLLLTTHLTPREIVVGKMMGRLVPMIGVLLAGVPILAILQLLGGISFQALLCHSFIALVLLLSIGMISIYASATCKTVGGAIFTVYFIMAMGAFLILTTFGFMLLAVFQSFPGLFMAILLLASICLLVSMLALWSAIEKVSRRENEQVMTYEEREREERVRGGRSLAEAKPSVAIVKTEKSETVETPPLPPPPTPQGFGSPGALSDSPILWKEMSYPTNELLILVSLILCFINIGMGFGNIADTRNQRGSLGLLAFEVNLLLALCALRAAGSLAIERKQRTLLSVLLIPWPWNRILLEYWWASFWRYRWIAFSIAFLAITCVGGYPSSSLLAWIAFFSQLAFLSMLSIASSLIFTSPFQARIMIANYLLFSYLLLPWIKQLPGMDFLWFFDLVCFPYSWWPSVETVTGLRLTILSPLIYSVLVMVNLAVVWAMTYGLLVLCRHRLGRVI